MKWLWAAAALVTVATLTGSGQAEEAPEIKVGDKAPNFKLMGTDGKEYTLEQFRGKSALVIAWYPKALTGG